MDDDNEIIAEGSNIETAVSHVAYDYYMAYIKDDMPHFKEASELLDIVIFHTLTHPNMIAYVNYCKVAASNEILNKLFDRDFKLKEPSAVAIDEMEYKVIGNGRLTNPDNEKIRQGYLKGIINGCNVAARILKDKNLSDLEEEIRMLKKGLLTDDNAPPVVSDEAIAEIDKLTDKIEDMKINA